MNRFIVACVTMALSASGGLPAAGAEGEGYPGNPDLRVHVSVETTPQAAEIVAPASGEGAEETVLGRSPYVAVVACSWPSGVFAKKWDRMQLWSPAGVCRSAYDAASKTYEIDATFVVRATGYASRTVDVHVATLKPKSIDWENAPETFRKTVEVELEPALAKAEPAPAVRTVVVASKSKGATGDPGTVLVESDAGGDRVFVDGTDVGATPLRLLLGPGGYALEIRRAGHATESRAVAVEPGSEVSLRVTLRPTP